MIDPIEKISTISLGRSGVPERGVWVRLNGHRGYGQTVLAAIHGILKNRVFFATLTGNRQMDDLLTRLQKHIDSGDIGIVRMGKAPVASMGCFVTIYGVRSKDSGGHGPTIRESLATALDNHEAKMPKPAFSLPGIPVISLPGLPGLPPVKG